MADLTDEETRKLLAGEVSAPTKIKEESSLKNYGTEDESGDTTYNPSKAGPLGPGYSAGTPPSIIYASSAGAASSTAPATSSTIFGGGGTILSESKYAGIASAVAGRLGYEYYGKLFSYLDLEKERADADRIAYASRAALIKTMADRAMVASPQDLAAIHAASAIVHIMPRGGGDITPRTEGALGTIVKPTTLLKTNVQFAASLVSMQLQRRDMTWKDIWDNGDREVRSMFAELVAMCIVDAAARMRERSGGAGAQVTKYVTTLQRRNEILRTFALLYSDSGDGLWHFNYETRAFDYSRNVDTTEAALNFVGY